MKLVVLVGRIFKVIMGSCNIGDNLDCLALE